MAAATNLATNAVPQQFTPWTEDPSWTWGTTTVLATLVILVGVALQRLSSPEPARPAAARTAELDSVNPAHNLSPRDPAFIGRDAVFERIEAELRDGPVAVVAMHGLGGMGKSAIALELAYRGHESGRYSIAWWIHAETESTLVEDISELAPILGLSVSDDQDQTVKEVRAALRNRNDWLIVFDNVADPDAVRPWLPGGSGATLITSRFRGWSKLAVQVDLDRFTREESLAYLAGTVERYDPAAANELAQVLGDLPLALVQAAGYLDRRDLPIERYLELYRDRDAAGRLLAEAVDGYPDSVATTWLLHYDQLAEDEPAALQLLRLCAFLDPEDIDLDLLLSVPELLPPELVATASPIDYERVVGELARANLVTRMDKNRIRLHRLVSQVTRLQLEASAGEWALLAATLVNRLFPIHSHEPSQWPRCALLAAHASSVIEHNESLAVSDAQARALYDRLGVYLQTQVDGDVDVSSLGPADWRISPVRSRYSHQIQRIAPKMLAGRDRELADLAAFTTSEDEPSYLWLRAGAGSGKTALLAWFALHPPAGVRVVSFFVSARWAGQSDRSAFVENVIEQLVEILGQPMPAPLSEATHEAHLHALLEEAAQACRSRGERLVLLVDGLDEDRGGHTGSDAHSIAALLPTHPPRGLRIIVADRPNSAFPADVPAHHSLRVPGIVRPLTLNPDGGTKYLLAEMKQELRSLLGAVGNQEVLGLITAAGGGLTVTDLAEITDTPAEALQDLINGCSFTKRSEGDRPPVYQLAHEQMHETVLQILGPRRIAKYRDALHSWADSYRVRKWPEDTPDYLLSTYPRMLHQYADVARLVDYVTDVARHDRMRQRFGGDAAAISEVDRALKAVAKCDNADLFKRLVARRKALQ
ncbi:DUF7779 domain-containing protein [Saccharopolyspora aridisoli]|uniref:DUF7779 domain-containing protein n=1 Tax=Saccharopolyspora aridisoli TaxID=2530385 RepID=UPI0014051009|nr:NB-ARC domain-containing protein [Saccharopolyspora aridisoli]